MGGVDRGCDGGHPFSQLWPVVTWHQLNHVLLYGMGWLLQWVADEATHLYPHLLYLGGDKGDRKWRPAVAEDKDFRGCGLNGLLMFINDVT